MAADFLRSHGIDIDSEMDRIQSGSRQSASNGGPTRRVDSIMNVSLTHTAPGSYWNVYLQNGKVSNIRRCDTSGKQTHSDQRSIDGKGAVLAASLCHPHVHLDKAYLLNHPKYADLHVERGDFQEAMELTSRAKAQFEEADLLERGQRLIDESVLAGVTHMRAFVEVDAGVGFKCLEAGIKLKRAAEEAGRCIVQLCAFAQLPLFSPSQGDDDGMLIRELMQKAASFPEVDVIGSAPYVESDRARMERNVTWMVDLSLERSLHLDFHLDYNLDPATEPLIWHVVRTLNANSWHKHTRDRTVVLGHCTRLTLLSDEEWCKLRDEIAELPVSFVGLPTSDLFMVRTPERTRGTLDVPRMIKEYGLNACIGINNIGNAFTPHGSCDPLTLACNGVGLYQAGTKSDAEILYECISTRARNAIGLGHEQTSGEQVEDLSHKLELGCEADFVLFNSEKDGWRTRKSISEAVYIYDHCQGRRGFLNGVTTR